MGQLLELLDKQRQKWAKDVLSLTDADKKEIALKRGFDNAMIDFFSFRYHKRSKLIDQSSVELGYCFKEVLSSSNDPVALTYVLFSPSPSVYEDENFLPQIAAKLFDLGREEIKKAPQRPAVLEDARFAGRGVLLPIGRKVCGR